MEIYSSVFVLWPFHVELIKVKFPSPVCHDKGLVFYFSYAGKPVRDHTVLAFLHDLWNSSVSLLTF